MTGGVKMVLNSENHKFEVVELTVTSFQEYIPRAQLQLLEQAELKQSPRVTKNAKSRAQQQKQQPAQPSVVLPASLVNENGVPAGVQGFLEV
jgi:hypothetical protein